MADTVGCPFRGHSTFLLTEPRFYSSPDVGGAFGTILLQGKNNEPMKLIREVSFLQLGLTSHRLVALLWEMRCKWTFTRCFHSYKMERHFFPPGIAGYNYFVTKRGAASLLRMQSRKTERIYCLGDLSMWLYWQPWSCCIPFFVWGCWVCLQPVHSESSECISDTDSPALPKMRFIVKLTEGLMKS